MMALVSSGNMVMTDVATMTFVLITGNMTTTCVLVPGNWRPSCQASLSRPKPSGAARRTLVGRCHRRPRLSSLDDSRPTVSNDVKMTTTHRVQTKTEVSHA